MLQLSTVFSMSDAYPNGDLLPLKLFCLHRLAAVPNFSSLEGFQRLSLALQTEVLIEADSMSKAKKVPRMD